MDSAVRKKKKMNLITDVDELELKEKNEVKSKEKEKRKHSKSKQDGEKGHFGASRIGLMTGEALERNKNKKSKKKKKKSGSHSRLEKEGADGGSGLEDKNTNCHDRDLQEETTDDFGSDKKKKQKKKKRRRDESDKESEQETIYTADEKLGLDQKSKKKKKGKKQRLDADEEETNYGKQEEKLRHNSNIVVNSTKTKKKLKENCNGCLESEDLDLMVNLKQKKTAKHETDIDSNIVLRDAGSPDISEASGKEKQKKKKRKRKHVDSYESDKERDLDLNTSSEQKADQKKRSKKKKKEKRLRLESETNDLSCNDIEGGHGQPKKKKCKKSIASDSDKNCGPEPEESIVKIKKERHTADEVRTSKLGDNNEDCSFRPSDSTMNQMKTRTDMQHESQGQWQGALFENAERQNKFLRLLGGKKAGDGGKKLFSSASGENKKGGLFGSLSSLVNRTSGNKAMTASAAASLNQSLEDQYNKALGLKLGKAKGCGFGYAPDPAEGKKFHIDTSKVNSVRFDDD